MSMLIIGQEANNYWGELFIQNAFWVGVLFIFLVAVVSLVVNQRRKDKCLKLLDNYHVSVAGASGPVMWGDLRVHSKGVELVYDKPYVNREGICKASSLLYEAEMGNVTAIGRSKGLLGEREQTRRANQIRKTFYPAIHRRFLRACRNVINSLKDAFSKALSAVIGQMAMRKSSTVVNNQQQGIDEIGQTLLGAAGNAYEPMLERHIGRRVVMRVKFGSGDETRQVEVPGYLAEYSEKYVAVFNTGQRIDRADVINLADKHACKEYEATFAGTELHIKNVGDQFVLLNKVVAKCGRGKQNRVMMPGVVIAPCGMLAVNCGEANELMLNIHITREVDLVCPRASATVYFGGPGVDYTEEESGVMQAVADELEGGGGKEDGVAPQAAAEQLIKDDDA